MTHEDFKKELEAIRNERLAEMAEESLSKLCATSAKSFTMSVPPNISDTDIIFSELIRRFKDLTENDY